MFRSATVKLTTLYLAIIMAISLFFSVNLYNLSYNELERGLRRQARDLERAPRLREYADRELLSPGERLEEGRSRILLRLLYANLGVALLGGVGSYFLARASLRPIEEAMEKQNRFTADASHELRTPLAAMQTEIEVALRDKKLTKTEARRLLSSNLEEVAKLSNLANGLLRLAHSDDKNMPTERVWLSEVVKEVTKTFTPAARKKGIRLSSNMGSIAVIADRQGIAQVLSILLDNAIKYSGKNATVSISAQREGRQAVVLVSDNGVGIKRSSLPHVFERFYRADTSRSKNETEGYGLGLSIAKQIVEQHEGTISVKSSPGQGATFTIKLPLASTT